MGVRACVRVRLCDGFTVLLSHWLAHMGYISQLISCICMGAADTERMHVQVCAAHLQPSVWAYGCSRPVPAGCGNTMFMDKVCYDD